MSDDTSHPAQYQSREQAIEEVHAIFARDAEIPDALTRELLRSPERFLEERHVRAAMPPGRPGRLGATYWAVRNDQLDLMKYLSATAVAIATFAAVAAASPYVLAASLIGAVLDVSRRLRKKKVDLPYDHYRVLLALKQTGPQSIEDLTTILNGLRGTGGGSLSDETVAALLKELSAIRAHDQTVEALVVQAGDGLWSVNGI